MKHLLLVAATLPEIAPLADPLGPIGPGLTRHTYGPHAVDVLVTGVGMVPTAVAVSRALATGRYDATVNLGVCGSFDRNLPNFLAEFVINDGRRCFFH